jgi:hypothetical protein
MSSVGKFRADIPLKGSAADIVIIDFRMPETEPVTMLGCEHHVFHAGRPGYCDPLLRIERNGIELFIEIIINIDGYFAGSGFFYSPPQSSAGPAYLRPFKADRSPVNEHSEPRFAPPFQPMLFFLDCFLKNRIGLGKQT